MKTLLFSQNDVRLIVDAVGIDRLMDEMIDALEATCLRFDPSEYSVPARSGFSYDDDQCPGLLEWMPVIRYGDRVVIKLVGYHPNNPKDLNLPTVLSTIVTFDTTCGLATSFIDGTFLTSMRTGAASALASSVLANPFSSTLGLIGAGAQAVTQLHALSRKFSFERIILHDIDVQTCNNFARRAAAAGLDIPVEVSSMEDVVCHADILCTSTSIDVGDGPLFESLTVRDSAHINAVGSDFPGKHELPADLLRMSLVCPDFREQAIHEGECQKLERDEIGPELFELVQQRGFYESYNSSLTVFDSTGWALEDLVASELLIRLGRELGLGTETDIQCISTDPKNPYGFLNGRGRATRQPSLDDILRTQLPT
jgi:ornithine cyclodeaminase/alanine dehydrogenase-like protein (mu-crystallin family)